MSCRLVYVFRMSISSLEDGYGRRARIHNNHLLQPATVYLLPGEVLLDSAPGLVIYKRAFYSRLVNAHDIPHVCVHGGDDDVLDWASGRLQ
jgi:hypothetical protein